LAGVFPLGLPARDLVGITHFLALFFRFFFQQPKGTTSFPSFLTPICHSHGDSPLANRSNNHLLALFLTPFLHPALNRQIATITPILHRMPESKLRFRDIGMADLTCQDERFFLIFPIQPELAPVELAVFFTVLAFYRLHNSALHFL